ncbi:DUF4232 domain-containing protein [Streptomyces sp. NBC_01255]|uniref:DUF4232 domain-containing protein n=1 Tax=Streptomyces sp. NBC_01255 TaxID=2903798 RepID=UPI002E353F22|nr:DUF4232 domain-containing protein [Streptomyces sp. NBC_01255]
MRSATLPAALAGLLLLTACGTEQAGGGPSGPSATAAGCAARPGDGSTEDGVTITGMGESAAGGAMAGQTDPCAEYTVTSAETEPFTYTIAFSFLTASGQAMATVKETVPAVAPGKTVRRTITAADVPADAAGGGRFQVLTVRSVPTAEAPSESGPCPPSGVRVYADDGDSAMGLRVVGLHLENCGTAPYELNGYPRIGLVDEEHASVDGVELLQGGERIAGATGMEGPARPLVLAPGERAYSGLVWRNTVEAGDPVNAPYARVRAKPGAAPVMVTPELDLGTTGKLGIGPWKKDGTR